VSETEDEADDLPEWARPEVRAVTAPAQAFGRLDAFLAGYWPDLSRARIQGLIGQGQLTLDGAVATHASAKVKPGGVYVLTLPPPAPPAPLPEAIALSIAYEDAHLIVVNKAAGMAAHPAAGSLTGTLVNALLHHCAASLSGVGGVARPGIVHRIDKDTTGLIVAAKSDVAHAGLAKQFAKHTIERAYYAVCRGGPVPRNGVVEGQLARSSEDRRKMAVVRDPLSTAGKRAVTHYWTIESFGQIAGQGIGRAAAALLECRLETGRTHQIRAHLAHLGCPLIGDQMYGKQRGFKVEGAGPGVVEAKAAVEGFARQALHAAVLGFIHPVTGEALRFEAPLPQDMEALLAALRGI
jgi:23S rRNA pseudouridine1911/1915/1917 synthase